MANEKNETTKKKSTANDLVSYFHPKDMRITKGDDGLLVSVNGKRIKIQTGEEIDKMPRKYVEVLKRSYKADMAATERAKKASGQKEVKI